jgi:hypothetical protein
LEGLMMTNTPIANSVKNENKTARIGIVLGIN